MIFCSIKHPRDIFLFLFLMIATRGLTQLDNPGMDDHRLIEVLNGVCSNVIGSEGYMQVEYKDFTMLVITDSKNNRMRIVCPIIEEKKLNKKTLKKAMAANFDKVLDVKYALYNGYVWSVFIHPLHELTGDQVFHAVDQVFMAAKTFGSSFTSSGLIFDENPAE